MNKPISGIYEIRNRHNGRVYIGKSKNVAARWDSHRDALKRGLHINSELQGDWEVYGADAFEFTVLEEKSGSAALSAAEARRWEAASNPYNVAPVRESRSDDPKTIDGIDDDRWRAGALRLAELIAYGPMLVCTCGRRYSMSYNRAENVVHLVPIPDDDKIVDGEVRVTLVEGPHT